jgi:hypothetical protein
MPKIERIPREAFGHKCFYMVDNQPYVPASSFFVGKVHVGMEYINHKERKAYAAPAPPTQREKLIEYAECYRKTVSEQQAEWEQANAKRQLRVAKKKEKLHALVDLPFATKAHWTGIRGIGEIYRLEDMPGLWTQIEQRKRSGVKAICTKQRRAVKFRRLSEDEESRVIEAIADQVEHPF